MTERAPQDEKIFELTDVYDEQSAYGRKSADGKGSQPVIVIDGRRYERIRPDGASIYDLTDVVDERLISAQNHDLVMKRAEEVIERIVREVLPDIAERVIREEIEKLKTSQTASKNTSG